MKIEIAREIFDGLAFDLNAAIADYNAALAHHANSEGEPAPTAHPLVEHIVRLRVDEIVVVEPPVRPEPPITVHTYRAAIQAHVDATAAQRSYDSGITCASYVNSTVEGWAAEAAAFVAWRDGVWAYAYAELAKVEAGARPQPTVEAIVSELPLITWPD